MTNDRLIDKSIEIAMAIKWRAGQVKYGTEFVGNPLEQADGELIDTLNYLKVAVEKRIIYPSEYARMERKTRKLTEEIRAMFHERPK